MPLYEHICNYCGEKFEKLRPMSECGEDSDCPVCGQLAPQVMSTNHVHWGWILTEKSHHKGSPDVWVQDRPSNEPKVDREKAPYEKTFF